MLTVSRLILFYIPDSDRIVQIALFFFLSGLIRYGLKLLPLRLALLNRVSVDWKFGCG